mmetsp:Transcript_8981/g.29668  ORF Transcript_8981/g.29668 Transcript_8981/m.29668 type:complete len:268 (+) Transcript_8981:1665-2468(+)
MRVRAGCRQRSGWEASVRKPVRREAKSLHVGGRGEEEERLDSVEGVVRRDRGEVGAGRPKVVHKVECVRAPQRREKGSRLRRADQEARARREPEPQRAQQLFRPRVLVHEGALLERKLGSLASGRKLVAAPQVQRGERPANAAAHCASGSLDRTAVEEATSEQVWQHSRRGKILAASADGAQQRCHQRPRVCDAVPAGPKPEARDATPHKPRAGRARQAGGHAIALPRPVDVHRRLGSWDGSSTHAGSARECGLCNRDDAPEQVEVD